MRQQKKLLPVREGQLGLRQSDAVFHHTAQLHALFEELVRDVDTKSIAAVGASVKPRPVSGSYMPCFTVGENTAKIISAALKVPFTGFSHQEGHIAAALYGSGRLDLFDKTFIAFHVSGGTTEAVLAKGSGCGFTCEIIAQTLDLNAGQAVDRVGLMLGLKFPCGVELEKLALQNDEPIKVRATLKGHDCCLSGVENLCQNHIKNGKSPEYTAAFCIEYIRSTLEEMTDRILEKYGEKTRFKDTDVVKFHSDYNLSDYRDGKLYSYAFFAWPQNGPEGSEDFYDCIQFSDYKYNDKHKEAYESFIHEIVKCIVGIDRECLKKLIAAKVAEREKISAEIEELNEL